MSRERVRQYETGRRGATRRRRALAVGALAAAALASVPVASANLDPARPDDTPSEANGPIAANSSFRAALATEEDVDFYALYPSVAGQQITVTVTNTSPPSGDEPNAVRADIEDADGELLDELRSTTQGAPGRAGPGQTDSVSWTLPTTDKYLIEVLYSPDYDQSPPASYQLEVRSPLPFRQAAAAPSPVTGTPRTPSSSPSPTQPARCAGVAATQVGSAGADTLRGTDGRDVIVARGGDDVVDARGGHDLVCGGGGRDRLAGGRGNDVLRGEAANDRMSGGGGNDRMLGGRGNDRIHGRAGADRLFGQSGRDSLFGNAGRDTLFGGGGRDLLQGGPGRNLLRQ